METLWLRVAGLPLGTNLWNKHFSRSAGWIVPYRFSIPADLYLSQVGATDNTLKEIWNACVLRAGCPGQGIGEKRGKQWDQSKRSQERSRTSIQSIISYCGLHSSSLQYQQLALHGADLNARRICCMERKLYSKLHDIG